LCHVHLNIIKQKRTSGFRLYCWARFKYKQYKSVEYYHGNSTIDCCCRKFLCVAVSTKNVFISSCKLP